MATLLLLAWLMPCFAAAAIASKAVRRRWTSGAGTVPVRVPSQRRGS